MFEAVFCSKPDIGLLFTLLKIWSKERITHSLRYLLNRNFNAEAPKSLVEECGFNFVPCNLNTSIYMGGKEGFWGLC